MQAHQQEASRRQRFDDLFSENFCSDVLPGARLLKASRGKGDKRQYARDDVPNVPNAAKGKGKKGTR